MTRSSDNLANKITSTRKKAPTTEPIFKDRRNHGSSKVNKPDACRRQCFSKLDAMPWWLKVNYVEQDVLMASKDSNK
ncbi:MAG: hypothetical protein ACJA0N_000963 [Pseudohongiellaceae bacterium]|jgi:hypothetical protein